MSGQWRRTLTAALAPVFLALGLVAVPAAPAAASATTFQNALWNGADPAVIRDGSSYFFSHADGVNKIYVSKSKTLTDRGTEKLVYEFPPGQWNSLEQWGPNALFRWNGQWFLYYMGDDGNNVNHRLGVLRADTADPQGTWTDLGQVNTGNSWAISGFPFQDQSGAWYLTWSGWENVNDGFPQNTYVAPMTNPWTIGARVKISTPDQSWENSSGAVQEGQIVLRRNGKLFLVYSCNASWTDNYCLGMLTNTGGSVLNPASWTKSAGPVFQQTSSVKGPGGPSIVPSVQGDQDWLVYHSNAYPGSGWLRRVVNAKQISYDANGNPVFGSPPPYGQQNALPSGDPGYRKPVDLAIGKGDGLPRYLWTFPDGKAQVWTLNAAGDTVVHRGDFGPYPGWRPVALSVGADNRPRLLWAGVAGAASLWTLNTTGTAQDSAADYGPFPDWLPADVAVGADNKARLLWRKTNGQASVWTMNTAGTARETYGDHGPLSGYDPAALAVGSDNKPHLLWTQTPSTGKVLVTRLSPSSATKETERTHTAPAGWAGQDLAEGPDNVIRVLWNQAATNRASLWTLSADLSTRASSADYGPFADWAADKVAVGTDNKPRLDWRYLSERTSLWRLNATGTAIEAQSEHQGSY